MKKSSFSAQIEDEQKYLALVAKETDDLGYRLSRKIYLYSGERLGFVCELEILIIGYLGDHRRRERE